MGCWCKISKCCCCCNLRTGSLIVGWLFIIGSLLNLLGSYKEFAVLNDLDASLKAINYPCDYECREWMREFILGGAITLIIINFIYLVTSCMLVHGIRKENPSLMTPFIYYVVLNLIFMLVVTIIGIVYLAIHSPGTLPAVFACTMLGSMLVNYYFVLVVKNGQREMIERLGPIPVPMEDIGFKGV